jgi:hypothetical protein
VLNFKHLHIEQRVNTGGSDCFGKALFFVGEFGVNDYSFVWGAGKTEDEVKSYVPKVVKNIAMAVEVYIFSPYFCVTSFLHLHFLLFISCGHSDISSPIYMIFLYATPFVPK